MKTAKPPLPGGRLLCPKFWALFCEHFLCIERRLGIELWRAIYPSAELLFQLAKIEDSGRSPTEIKRFAQLLPPAELLKACERLSPSKRGKPRRRDVVDLEEAILARCDGQGRWI